ncbi:MAG: PEP/pyruvate-binding domain-containing protein [Acidobacteriota bacterium]
MSLKGFASRIFGQGKAAPPSLDLKIDCFREVLQANNAALGCMATIQQVLAGEKHASAAEVRRLVTGVTVQTYRMVVNLTRMTGSKYRAIVPRFEELKEWITKRVEVTPVLSEVGPVIPLSEVGAGLAEVVGQKSAFLGEARRILGGHVPDGFVTTVTAYRELMCAGGLGERIAQAMAGAGLENTEGCFRVSAEITRMVEGARIPPALSTALRGAAAELPGGQGLRLAVRSSALQEGGLELSFAGQYRSMLNVTRDGVLEAFKQVIASKYSPQAITYRLGRGFDDHEVAMCCCVISMVDATAAGVLYSACRTEQGEVTLLQAVRGLGLSAVDGSVEPDTYVFDRPREKLLSHKQGVQTSLLRCASGEGTEKLELDSAAAGTPILSEEQANQVARLAWRLDSALGTPIDMEWALDADGKVYVLQVRPQPVHAEEGRTFQKARIEGVPVLLEGGSRASGGAACGDVFAVKTDLDIIRCPRGAVIVTDEANPRLAVLLQHASAIVSDMGEVTGHLATVARELRVPALFATRSATRALKPGILVTVDADAGVVYAGRVEGALAAATPYAEVRRNPHVELLASVAEKITPLTLQDRLASGCSPRKCNTIHDIIRFCHQATVESMFALGDRATRQGAKVRRLVSAVPIDCRVLDLGGGLRDGLGEGDVTIDDVTCIPMRVLWNGMTDPRLKWQMERPVSLKGFMSAIVNYNFDQDVRMRAMGEPSYAFITANYLNLNSRIGYHFSTVDSRIGEAIESNYLSFRFVGGSTGIDQRSRRAQLIQRLLLRSGFETDCRADLINARVRHLPSREMEDKLFLTGLVMGYVNHLDMALVSDGVMRAYEDAFMAGDYGFKGSESMATGDASGS